MADNDGNLTPDPSRQQASIGRDVAILRIANKGPKQAQPSQSKNRDPKSYSFQTNKAGTPAKNQDVKQA